MRRLFPKGRALRPQSLKSDVKLVRMKQKEDDTLAADLVYETGSMLEVEMEVR